MRNPLERLGHRRSGEDDPRTTGGENSAWRSLLRRDSVRSAPFWLPPFLLVGLFVYGGVAWNVLLSLTDFAGLGEPDYSQLDLENYAVTFADPVQGFLSMFGLGSGSVTGRTPTWSDLTVSPIWNSLGNTVALMVGFSVACLALGLVLAILVDQEIRFEDTFRTIYLLPMSLSFVVTAKFWLFMYNPETGLINLGIQALGFGPVEIVQNPQLKLGAVAFALIWQFSGYAMIVYLAALRSIPSSHFEAARVDGASTVRMYWRVIIPQLRTATVSALVVITVFALKAFDFLFSMYGGYQPGPSADILATRMVREAYSNGNWAYGSTIAVVLFAMALLIVGPYIYSQYQRGEL